MPKLTRWQGFMLGATLALLLLGVGLIGSNSADGVAGAQGAAGTDGSVPVRLQFKAVPNPTTDAQKRSILASSSLTVNGTTTNIGYNVLARSGDTIGSSALPFGTMKSPTVKVCPR